MELDLKGVVGETPKVTRLMRAEEVVDFGVGHYGLGSGQ